MPKVPKVGEDKKTEYKKTVDRRESVQIPKMEGKNTVA
jgi:hypothetical protein